MEMGELLPRLSILTAFAAVYFCCTFPEVTFGGRYPLSLPYEARTFLMIIPFGTIPRDCSAQSACFFLIFRCRCGDETFCYALRFFFFVIVEIQSSFGAVKCQRVRKRIAQCVIFFVI